MLGLKNKELIQNIHKLAKELGREVNLMEVCGIIDGKAVFQR
jgi:hydrogenase maturation factor